MEVLFFWWFCHALVVGSARVIFETNLPGIISNTNEYRDFTQADVPALLLSIGTLVIIVGKFSSGPLIAALDPYLIGVGCLLPLWSNHNCLWSHYTWWTVDIDFSWMVFDTIFPIFNLASFKCSF